MNRTLDDTEVQRNIPPVWEILRAASGLVAVLVLAGVISASVLFGESRASVTRTTVPTNHAAVDSELAAGRRPAPSSVQPWGEVLVLYVVGSRQQAEYANRLENEAIKDTLEVLASGQPIPSRTSHILSARDEDEVSLAARYLFDELLQNGNERLIQVIDLREAFEPHITARQDIASLP